jgi:hypothetical protein
MQALTKTAISVDEYLATSFSPDCDYVDGHVEERNAVSDRRYLRHVGISGAEDPAETALRPASRFFRLKAASA